MKTIKCACGTDILFDDNIDERFLKISWTCKGSGGVRANGENYLVSHLLPVEEGMTVDHKDNNIHNFQSSNLREATYQQQNFNRRASKRSLTGYKGVSVDVRAKKTYRAFICKDNKRMYIGSYHTAEEAAHAYDVKAKQLFGEFANLNFP